MMYLLLLLSLLPIICLDAFIIDGTSCCNHFSSPNQLAKRYRLSQSLSLYYYSAVNVYNNVIDDDTCKHLHKLTLQHMKRTRDGSSIFYRGNSKRKQRLTPIETCIDQILVELDDSSPIVEYWSRSNYINMDAHADIDEDLLKDEGILRCPSNGHVLYMQIASGNLSDDDNNIDNSKQVMACPTVVFPTRKIAWGSVTPMHGNTSLEEEAQEYIVDVENYWSEEEKEQYGYTSDIDEDKLEKMVIVPAVNGRLFRFDGAAFHAVPRPADRFLMGEQDLALFLEREREEEDDDDDDYWDNDDDDYDDMEEENTSKRSVILFNTWPEGSNGPRGVLPDRIIDSIPDGISIGDAHLSYGKEFETVMCNPSSEWSLEEVTSVSGDIVRDVTIPLMGNPSRRGCIQTEDTLKGSVSSENFLKKRTVSLVTLHEKERI